MTKRRKVKYGHLPAKEADVNLWDVLCIDLIGPYTFKQPNNQTQALWALTMIDVGNFPGSAVRNNGQVVILLCWLHTMNRRLRCGR